jgi:hypothetical protein
VGFDQGSHPPRRLNRRFVVGTDYPTLWNRNPIDGILSVPGLSDQDRTAIFGGTLTKLLKIDA